ncbi:hypothetical protein [Tateyamaria sp. syn59]|uniref:hypothetical protein n=1 Tax=Tateyamaria sp. syn59 TaxID=2576942 RepID=UPI0011BDBD62|nr:hypothetical protein [Tateyamaria sp. syn59]
MTHGITYAGEIGRVGAGRDPQEVVELVCTDPRFIEAASAKKPNFLVRLFNGAMSFPRDWWYGTTFLSMRFGLFGAEGQAATQASASTITRLLAYGLNNPPLLGRTISVVMGHLRHYPEFWARSGTQLAVGYTISAALGPAVGIAAGAINFFLATTGAVVRAVDNGADSLAEIIVAATLGYSDPELSRIVAQEVALPSPEDGDYSLDDEEEDYIVEVLRGVLYCVRNPGEFMNTDERRAVMVPVGRVSSARPRGVMGNIPVGYETNALDVIAEEAARLRGEFP